MVRPRARRAAFALSAVLGAQIWLLSAAAVAESAAEPSPAQAAPPKAVRCSAALSLMAVAAPNWSALDLAREARDTWRREAELVTSGAADALERGLDISMRALAIASTKDPDAIARQAAICVIERPKPAAL